MKRVVLAAMFVVMVAATSASAETIAVDFDFDGGGAAGSTLITNLDWNVGNSVIIATPTRENPLSFTILYQANLAIADVLDEDAIDIVNGSFGTFFTAVAGFGVTVDVVQSTANNTVFMFDPASSTNFFNIYADAEGGNNLSGLGFAADAGATLVLSGTAISQEFSSSFLVTDPDGDTGDAGTDPDRALDGFNANDYPGVYSILGSGGTNLNVKIDYFDPLYFLNLVAGQTLSFINTSQIDPYTTVNPSNTFSGNGIANGGTCGVPCVGSVNGMFLDGADRIVAQSDANSSFAVVPEPASLMLFGLGILGVAAARRRHMKNQQQ